MKVLCIQAPRLQASEALAYIEKILNKFNGQEFQLVAFPEKWVTNALPENDSTLREIIGYFQDFSGRRGCSVVPGSFSIERDGNLYNSSPFIHNGEVQGFQDKISLFKIENGRYAKGKGVRIFDMGNLKVAIAVCYDLDFPYFAKMAVANGASLIVNPSLITAEFREMWHIYVKGRSLETRLPVVSINSISEPFHGGSIVTRMKPSNGGIFLEQEFLGNHEAKIVKTNPEDMGEYIAARHSEDPGSYSLNSR